MARWLAPWSFGGERQLGMDPFWQLHREMNRLFDDVLRGTRAPAEQGETPRDIAAPRMDISETENEIKICAELPGVDEKDVEVTLDGDLLTIRGEKKVDIDEQRENYHVVERSRGSFARSIRLPEGMKAEEANASFQNGVLTVTLPKTPEQQRRARRIEVRGSQAGQQPANVNVGAEQSAAAGSKPGAGSAPPSGSGNSR